jgi:hypothetical protein
MNSNRSRYIAGGLLAVGLSIGAALATPGVASADPSTDPFSWIGGLDPGALSAAAPSDMQISIDGMDLFPSLGNTATAISGMGDIAIAIGSGSTAEASGGIFDTAFADGNASHAGAIGGNFDSATVFGLNSIAVAEFGNGDVVSVVNTGTSLTGDGAGAGGLGPSLLGNNDIASVVGTSSIADAGAGATAPGSFDLAAVDFGNLDVANAIGGNFMIDISPAL